MKLQTYVGFVPALVTAQTQSGSQCDPVKKDVEYFKNKVIENTDILEGMAVKWDKITEGLVDVSEEGV